MSKNKSKVQSVPNPAGPVYVFGGIGALIYYIQVSDGFWQIVLAFLKSVVWPALFTHDVLKFIG